MEPETKKNDHWYGIGALLLLILLGIYNPNELTHKEKITSRVRYEANKDVSGQIAVALGLADMAVKMAPIRYDNYVLFSTTTGEGKGLLTIGICGIVFFVN